MREMSKNKNVRRFIPWRRAFFAGGGDATDEFELATPSISPKAGAAAKRRTTDEGRADVSPTVPVLNT